MKESHEHPTYGVDGNWDESNRFGLSNIGAAHRTLPNDYLLPGDFAAMREKGDKLNTFFDILREIVQPEGECVREVNVVWHSMKHRFKRHPNMHTVRPFICLRSNQIKCEKLPNENDKIFDAKSAPRKWATYANQIIISFCSFHCRCD